MSDFTVFKTDFVQLNKRRRWLYSIVILLDILFLYTSMSKLLNLRLFRAEISLSPIIGSTAPFLAIILPTSEIILAIFLVFNKTRLAGFYICLIFLVLFTIYIWVNQTLSPSTPCSCGGVLELLSLKTHVFVNCTFIGLSILGITLQRSTILRNE